MQSRMFFIVFISLVVSLGGFLFGLDAALIGGATGFIITEFDLNEFQKGFVVSAPILGGILAALVAGPLSDYIGRKKILIVIAFLYILTAAGSAVAPNWILLTFFRFIGGLAFASLGIAPMYIAEISPSKYRGIMVSINQLNIVIGFFAAFCVSYFFQQAMSWDAAWVQTLEIEKYVWRWMLGVGAIPAVFYFIFMFFVPESPRWLVVQGKIEQAKKSLSRLGPADEVESRIKDIQHGSLEVQEPFFERLRQVLGPAMRFTLTLGLIVAIVQQITGINAIYFYAQTIFAQSGVGSDAAFSSAVWLGLTSVVFTIVAMVLIDRVGRRPLLITGVAGVLISLSLCFVGFHNATYKITPESAAPLYEQIDEAKLQPIIGKLYKNDVQFKNELKEILDAKEYSANESALLQAGVSMNAWIVLIGILGFIASFAISLGPVMWVILSEIFPNKLRGVAMAFVGFFNAFVSWFVTFIFPYETSVIGVANTFLIYAVFALIGLVLIVWLFPETKGKSLEELEDELAVIPAHH